MRRKKADWCTVKHSKQRRTKLKTMVRKQATAKATAKTMTTMTTTTMTRR